MRSFLLGLLLGGACALIIASWIKPPEKIIFPFLSLIRCWKGWLGTLSSVTWLGIQVSFKSLSIQVIRRRQWSRAAMVLLPVIGRHSGCVMPLPPFNGLWLLYFLISLKISWRCSWMTSLSTEVPLTYVLKISPGYSIDLRKSILSKYHVESNRHCFCPYHTTSRLGSPFRDTMWC